MTAMKQQKYRKRKQTIIKRKYLKTSFNLKVEQKVERKKVTMANKTE